ncbi:uncharacterized protein LOC131667738 [Phymastichus coffea]|uniref:uncharacterized protein LOC131667738 n=1 Tax=Phymastichus coffea TaxID=108790 RepID=UPI00273CB748|nr:uncharacterized protein LOC131667738 [Phymastichus coffea]
MSLETPRSSAGLTTPRTFEEVFSDYDNFQELLDETEKCIDEQEELWSCSSSSSHLLNNDDVKLNAIVSRLVNACFDYNKCESENLDKLSLLEIKFTEELMARHRQMSSRV